MGLVAACGRPAHVNEGTCRIMGFDEIKNKITDAVSEHGDKVEDGIDKAAEFADEKTGGKFSDHIDTGSDKASEFMDKLDGDDES